MMNAARKTVRYSLLILALLLVALIAAPFFIDANKYKSLIVDQAEKATGRQIEIGQMHASFFPWVGLRIDDVHIANPDGFVPGDMLQVKSLDVQVAVMPLLTGKYQIKRFVLDGPQLKLIRTADGYTNWEDLLPSAGNKPAASAGPAAAKPAAPAAKPAAASSKPAAPKATGGGILAAFSAQALRMKNGEVHFSDAKSGTDIHLTDLNIEVNDVQVQNPFSLKVSGKLNGDAFSLDGMVGPLGDVNKLDVAKLPLKGHLSVPGADLTRLSGLVPQLAALGGGTLGLDAQLEQRPNGVRVMAGSVKLHAAHDVALDLRAQMPDAERMQIEQLLARLDGVQVADVSGTVTGIGGNPRYQLRVNTPELTRVQLAQWLPQLQTMYAGNPDPWKTVKLGMLAAGDSKAVDIRDLQLMLNKELVQASGKIGFAGAPDIRLRVSAQQLHVDPWLPQSAAGQQAALQAGGTQVPAGSGEAADQQGARIGAPAPAPAAATTPAPAPAAAPSRAAAPAAAKPPVEPDLRFLKPWKIAAVMQVDHMWLRGLDITHLRAEVNGNNGVINMSPLAFDLAGGHVEEQAGINAGVYPATWNEAVNLHDVQVQTVLKALAGTDMLSGKLQMQTHLGGRGLLPDAAISRLNGTGSVLLRDGSIKGFDIAALLRNIKNFGQGSGPQEKTDFSELSGSFNIRNGVAKNDDLFAASPLFRLTGYGVVNLPTRQMDYHLKPRLVGTLVGQGDSEAVRKGLEVPIRLTGPLDAPKVRLEVTVKSLLGNQKAIQQIIKNPKGALQQLLGGAAGNQGGQQKSQQPAQQPKTQQPAQQLDKLLRKVLPGL